MRTTVHLLRHGEVHNPDKVLYGRLPGYRLSELGHEMAQRAAEALASRDVTAVIASPLERAQQTAAPVTEFCDSHELGNISTIRFAHHGVSLTWLLLLECAKP